MRVITHSPNKSIFSKIVLTFLALLIPMYTLNLYMNESGRRSVRKEIVDSMSAKVELYLHLIESDFDRVIQLVEAYVNDKDLLKLSTSIDVLSDIERTAAVLSLKSKLDLVESSNVFVRNVSAFIPLMNRSVTSNDDAIVEFDREAFQALAVSKNRYESPYLLWKGRLFISVPYPDPPAPGRKQPLFLLTVEVSEQGLRDALRQFTNNGETAVLIGRHPYWTLSSEEGQTALPIGPAIEPGKSLVESRSVDGRRMLVISRSSSKLDTTLSLFMPESSMFGPLERYRWWMLLLTLFSVVIIVFFALSLYRIIQRPLRTLIRSFNKVEQGNLNLVVQYPLKDEFGFLYERFNAMVKELNVLVHEVYEHKYRVRLAELRHLQSQIHPHFLYNSFFILHRMAKLDDRDNIVRFTQYLGEYFQFITRDGSDEIPLAQEAKVARTYMEIQSFRFGTRIRGEFGDIPEELKDCLVPRLVLQPLIENAYHHGLENKMTDGLIRVAFRRDESKFVVTVEDNGDELDDDLLQALHHRLIDIPDGPAENTGIINVHRRIRIKHGPDSGLYLSRSEYGGLLVELRLPCAKEEDS